MKIRGIYPFEKKIAIFGAGGFAKEVFCCISDILRANSLKDEISRYVLFTVGDEYYFDQKVLGIDVVPLSKLNLDDYEFVIAVGDPHLRKRIVERLPENTEYTTIIHPTAIVSDFVDIGKGVVIAAGCILTCDISIGDHVQLNLKTTIGHDCSIGRFVTIAPGVNVSGNCRIGENVYIGTNSAVRDEIKICNDSIVGMGSVVVKDISEKGIHAGNPARKIK